MATASFGSVENHQFRCPKSPQQIKSPSAWKKFWERGGWWKGVVLAAVYFVLYQLIDLGIGYLFAPYLNDPTSGRYILLFYVLPIGLAGALLVLFALSLGWLKELFARHPVHGRRWMWAAVALVLVFNVARFATTDYESAGIGYAASWLLAGLCVGFAEEVLTRGFVVNLMRKAGHPELAVALVSAGVFSAMHAGNLLTGQGVFATALQVVYTFAFGICMYLTLRVTGNLIWPVLLHASTDPSIYLQAGYRTEGIVAQLASMGNIPVIVFGFVAIFFIRGKLESQNALAAGALSETSNPRPPLGDIRHGK